MCDVGAEDFISSVREYVKDDFQPEFVKLWYRREAEHKCELEDYWQIHRRLHELKNENIKLKAQLELAGVTEA